MEKVLEHLIEPFLLRIFFQDFLQEDAYLINLSIRRQKVEGLGWEQMGKSGTEGMAEAPELENPRPVPHPFSISVPCKRPPSRED